MTKRATTGKANRNPVRASTSDSGEGRSHAEARPVPLSGRTPTCCPKRRCTPRPEPRFVHLAILTCPAGRPGRVRPREEHVLSCTDARVVLGCASKWSDIGARAIGALAQRYLSKPHSPPRGRSRGTTRRLTPRTALLRPFPSIGARTAPRNRKYLFHRGGHHRSNLLRAPGAADARALRGRRSPTRPTRFSRKSRSPHGSASRPGRCGNCPLGAGPRADGWFATSGGTRYSTSRSKPRDSIPLARQGDYVLKGTFGGVRIE